MDTAPTEPPPAVRTRPVEDADWPQVHALVADAAAHGRTLAIDVPADPAQTRAQWAGETVVVAVDGTGDGDRVLGAATAGARRPGPGSHVGTGSVVVAPAERGRGVGRALGAHLLGWHRAQGHRAVQVEALATDPAAARLSRTLGFEVVGTLPGATALPDGTYADLLVLHLDLADPADLHDPAAPADRTTSAPAVHRAAVESFTRWGWSGTSFTRVAELSGVPEVELGRRYASLGDLLVSVIREEMSGSGGDMRSSLEDRAIGSLPLEERADAVADFVLGMIRSLAPLVRALWQAADEDPVAEALRRGAELRRVGLSRQVVELLTRGERPVDGAVGAVQALCLAENYLCLRGVGWDDAQYVRWLAPALVHAVNGS